MDYLVSNPTQLVEAIDAGANFADYICLQDGTDLTGANVTRELDYHIANGGHVTVGSSLPAWFVFERDCSLTVRWEGECVLSFAPLYDGVNAVVRLVGWPEDGPEVRAVQDLLGPKGIKVLVVEDDTTTPERVAASDIQVLGPPHYVWLGEALAKTGAPALSADLQAWDLLDALFPDNPHLWNAGKYLTRFGRKGDPSKRVEDLRKAATYLERAIKAEERNAS
nr:MAG TPA: nucelotide kinase [Caudoviricetes sp.]